MAERQDRRRHCQLIKELATVGQEGFSIRADL